MPSLKLPILDLKVIGFSHWLLKNSVFSVDSTINLHGFSLEIKNLRHRTRRVNLCHL